MSILSIDFLVNEVPVRVCGIAGPFGCVDLSRLGLEQGFVDYFSTILSVKSFLYSSVLQ